MSPRTEHDAWHERIHVQMPFLVSNHLMRRLPSPIAYHYFLVAEKWSSD
jgi:hypothetical protein